MVVIGVGNEFRRDDAVGVRAIERLKLVLPMEVLVFSLSGEGTELMQAWAHEQKVWLIDAVYSGATPGTIFEIDAVRETVPAHFFPYSSHAFGLAEAIELSKAMDLLPPQVKLYGVEGKDFGAGTGLSREVESALEKVVRRVAAEIEASVAADSALVGDTIAS